MIAGSEDNIIPATLNARNFKAYKSNISITHFKVFEGRNHYTVNQKGWEAVADYALNWIEKTGSQKESKKRFANV